MKKHRGMRLGQDLGVSSHTTPSHTSSRDKLSVALSALMLACTAVPVGWGGGGHTLPGELRSPTHSNLAEILELDGTAGAGGMAPPTSTRIYARLKRGGDLDSFTVATQERTVGIS